MSKKCFIVTLSLFLSIYFSGLVSAEWVTDAASDALVAGYDIDQVKVDVYPPDAQDVEEYMKIGLIMDDKLPGIVLFEFDVDNNAATGDSTGMASSLDACEGTGTIKPGTPGFDITILLILRDQGDDAQTAWCYQCLEGPYAERGTECSGCSPGNCYTVGNPCNCGDLDCYAVGESCTGTGCDNCFVMNEVCGAACGRGRILGEWYVMPNADPGILADRGRIVMPLPKETDSDFTDCYTFPWKMIVESTYNALGVNPKKFDLESAKDPANLKYQVSTWVDPNYSSTENDYIDQSGSPCNEVTDVLPNSGKADAQQGAEICDADTNGDGFVDINDLLEIKSEFNRTDCPTCN